MAHEEYLTSPRKGVGHECKLDDSVHYSGRSAANVWRSDERSIEQVDGESMARFGGVVRGDYIFLHGAFSDDASPVADGGEFVGDAVVGGIGRARGCGAGIRRFDAGIARRSGTVCWIDGDSRVDHIDPGGSLRMVSHGSTPCECVANSRRSAADRRRIAHFEVLSGRGQE